MQHFITPYPAVNELLHLLLSKVQEVLGENFVGLYLYGSLASGDFDRETSDVDFLVVTSEELAEEEIQLLENMHAGIMGSGLKWAEKLEGSYLSLQALRRYDPGDILRPCHNEGKFYLSRHGSDWVIQRHILREHGVVVEGPSLCRMIDPVQPDDLRQAVAAILHEWWEPMLSNPERMRTSDYQAYAVLTICRALYTLERGEIVSKRASAKWFQSKGLQWSELVSEALEWRPGIYLNRIDEVLDLVKFAVSKSVLASGHLT